MGIDNDLVVSADEEIFEMNNGCICCTVRGDLIRIVNGLIKRAHDFDAIIIETTGLADPAPVAQTFFVDDDVKRRTRLDSIVTVVDACHLSQRLDDSHEAVEQIAFADTLLLNKIDLVSAAELLAVERQIRTINPQSRLFKTRHCQVPISSLMHRHAFDLDHILKDVDQDFLIDVDHAHDTTITSVALQSASPLHPDKFDDWFRTVIASQGRDILRSKGILNFLGSDKRFVLQGVHMLIDGDYTEAWRSNEARASRLVFIGRNLDGDALGKGFNACQAQSV